MNSEKGRIYKSPPDHCVPILLPLTTGPNRKKTILGCNASIGQGHQTQASTKFVFSPSGQFVDTFEHFAVIFDIFRHLRRSLSLRCSTICPLQILGLKFQSRLNEVFNL